LQGRQAPSQGVNYFNSDVERSITRISYPQKQ